MPPVENHISKKKKIANHFSDSNSNLKTLKSLHELKVGKNLLAKSSPSKKESRKCDTFLKKMNLTCQIKLNKGSCQSPRGIMMAAALRKYF